MTDETRLIHAAPTNMVPWTLEALRDGPCERSELLRHVDTLARLEGFRANDVATLKKALGSLNRDGRVVNVRKAWWRLATTGPPGAKRRAAPSMGQRSEGKRPKVFVGSSTAGLSLEQPSSDVHPVAEDVIVLDYDVALVDADSIFDAPVPSDRRIAL